MTTLAGTNTFLLGPTGTGKTYSIRTAIDAGLEGPTGTGKTYSIRTAIDAGLEVFVISTEPGIASTLGDTDPSKLHWHYISPADVGWSDLIDSAKKINMLSYEALAKMTAINKGKYTQFIDLLTVCNDYTDDRTGETFGDVSEWGPERMLVVDSLSGLNIMAMNLVIGSKPTKSPSDWGTAMDNLKRLILKLVTDTQCFFTLTGHLSREKDEISGAIKLMPSTLGQKLAPELPLFFDEVIMAKREGANFTWDTAASGVDLKARNLPFSDKLPPDFKLIVAEWEKNGGDLAEAKRTAERKYLKKTA